MFIRFVFFLHFLRISFCPQLNKAEFEDVDDETRVHYEGFRPGMYVRLEIFSLPSEFVTNFDPQYPIILGGLGSSEGNVGYLQVCEVVSSCSTQALCLLMTSSRLLMFCEVTTPGFHRALSASQSVSVITGADCRGCNQCSCFLKVRTADTHASVSRSIPELVLLSAPQIHMVYFDRGRAVCTEKLKSSRKSDTETTKNLNHVKLHYMHITSHYVVSDQNSEGICGEIEIKFDSTDT